MNVWRIHKDTIKMHLSEGALLWVRLYFRPLWTNEAKKRRRFFKTFAWHIYILEISLRYLMNVWRIHKDTSKIYFSEGTPLWVRLYFRPLWTDEALKKEAFLLNLRWHIYIYLRNIFKILYECVKGYIKILQRYILVTVRLYGYASISGLFELMRLKKDVRICISEG